MLLKEQTNYKFFGWLIIAATAFIALLFTVVNPIELGGFKFGHFLLSYEHEFLKRGFVGEAFRWVFDDLSYNLFNRFSFLLFFFFTSVFLYLSFVFLRSDLNKSGAWLFISVFLLGSFSLQHFYYDIGRFDQLIILIGLGLTFIIRSNLKVFYIISPVAFLLMFLIHEAAFFIVLPFILAYAIYKKQSMFNYIFLASLLMFSVFSTAVIWLFAFKGVEKI